MIWRLATETCHGTRQLAGWFDCFSTAVSALGEAEESLDDSLDDESVWIIWLWQDEDSDQDLQIQKMTTIDQFFYRWLVERQLSTSC